MSHSRWQSSNLQTLIQRKYVSDREPGTMELKEIAAAIKNTEYGEMYGWSYGLIASYFRGDEIPPPEFFPALFCVTGDIDVINWYLSRCGGLPLFSGTPENNFTLNGSPVDELLDVFAKAGKLSGDVKAAIADGDIDSRESMDITNDSLDMINTLTQLIEEVKLVKHERGTKHYKETNHVMSITKG